jgi:hypothetical protein
MCLGPIPSNLVFPGERASEVELSPGLSDGFDRNATNLICNSLLAIVLNFVVDMRYLTNAQTSLSELVSGNDRRLLDQQSTRRLQ